MGRGVQSEAWMGRALLALLAGAVLAGCVEPETPTARGLLGEAEAKAQDWASDARLLQAGCVEGTYQPWMDTGMHFNRSRMETPVQDGYGKPVWSRASKDDEAGDGNCAVWAYQFASPSRPDSRIVVVDSDGHAISIRPGAGPYASYDFSESPPLGDWDVDSDEAALIAKDASGAFRYGLGTPGFGWYLLLSRPPSQATATWSVVGGNDPSGDGLTTVLIDAAAGRVLSVQDSFP